MQSLTPHTVVIWLACAWHVVHVCQALVAVSHTGNHLNHHTPSHTDRHCMWESFIMLRKLLCVACVVFLAGVSLEVRRRGVEEGASTTRTHVMWLAQVVPCEEQPPARLVVNMWLHSSHSVCI